MKTSTEKHEAYGILFSMLFAEDRLVEKWKTEAHPNDSELRAHSVDLDTARGRRIKEQYRKALRRAAAPVARYLISQGDDLGTDFPFD